MPSTPMFDSAIGANAEGGAESSGPAESRGMAYTAGAPPLVRGDDLSRFMPLLGRFGRGGGPGPSPRGLGFFGCIHCDL